MTTKLITCFQIFGLGFSFVLAGPCFLSCTPILVTYLAAKQLKLKESLKNILVFSLGRLLAYILLGFFVGISAGALRNFTDSKAVVFLKPLTGLLIIFMGVIVLSEKNHDFGLCGLIRNKLSGFTNLFTFGFIIGVSPCVPLLALLFEISLISRNAWQAMVYALCFGMGTLIGGLIVIGSLAGIFSWLPLKLLHTKKANSVFKIICALILISLGLNIFFGGEFFVIK